MENQNYLLSFFSRVEKDYRINKAHMSVYMALYYLWSLQGFKGLLYIYSVQILPIAKISTCGTYYTVMKQLHEYGYLSYEPSFYRKRPSKVNLETSVPS
ncbi:hypothetical protein MMC2321_02863 [Chitinophaga sp. MM2321]